ncbi:trypco2 family protein [Streptomyces luteogriseus]|uniref:trypco2 family protein n=1 Tax=Streptomyces luteogriseus TaxID=68233 RepID=UPI0036B93492
MIRATHGVEPAELSDAIQAVRAGLAAAQTDGVGSPIRFTVKDIVLDLGIELRQSASAGGRVKAFVVSADARGERASTATHRMTVTLQVETGPGGRDVLIGDAGRGLDPVPAPPAGM